MRYNVDYLNDYLAIKKASKPIKSRAVKIIIDSIPVASSYKH